MKHVFAAAFVLLAVPSIAHAACYNDVPGPNTTCTSQPTYLHNGAPQTIDDAGHGLPTVGAASLSAGKQLGLTVASSTALTPPSNATWCVVQVDSTSTAAVRWLDDGSTPTASAGLEIAIGGSATFRGAGELAALKFVQEASSAILNVSYYQ